MLASAKPVLRSRTSNDSMAFDTTQVLSRRNASNCSGARAFFNAAPLPARLMQSHELSLIGADGCSGSRRRPEPQAGAEKLLRKAHDEEGNWQGLRHGDRQGNGDFRLCDSCCQEAAPAIGGREMLHFRSTHSRSVARRMTNFQTVPRVRYAKKGVIEQKKPQQETNPLAPR